MAEGGYPSVYVVDTHANRPPVPPRLTKKQRCAGLPQNLLFLLVSVALCVMTIEAYFIYDLYHSKQESTSSFSKHSGDPMQNIRYATPKPNLVVLPSKPVAHLTDGQDIKHQKDIMEWSMDADPLLFEMGYEKGGLVILKEGYYHIYSKVSFYDIDKFHHSIILKTKRYRGNNIPLLESRKYSEGSSKSRSNSYLAGVFHLFKDDVLFVKVSNTSKIVRYKSYENIFGAYMI